MFEGLSILLAVLFGCLAIGEHVHRHLEAPEITDTEQLAYNRMLREAAARRTMNYF
jgi:hypothetical protein